MTKKNILYVSSEVVPYLPETESSSMAFEVPKMVNENGGQTRIFIPKYGIINERRHQLHEVIRLSGMNLVINDIDMPLIIKVASIPKVRMQVYFVDNDEYFKKKSLLTDEENNLYPDNDERAIFFSKGVVETVKKLNWSPDIIHVQGWIASLLPLYLRKYYKDEPLFKDTKIVTSLFAPSFDGSIDNSLADKIRFDDIDDESLQMIKKPTHANLMRLSIAHSDALIIASKDIEPSVKSAVLTSGKPLLNFTQTEAFHDAYEEFYMTQVLK
jgi:starch synthase